jgi:DNA-binding transcriptional MerR regulator
VSASGAYLRIGELSRRSGVSPELLRAWERRYGLLRPERTRGGFRLYTERDEARIRAMQEHLRRGVSAAEAARLALATAETEAVEPAVEARAGKADAAAARLRGALDDFDEAAAQGILDTLLAAFSVEAVLRDVVIPYLHELGERYERGEVSIAQEHFASNVLRGRMTALARGWGRGTGPLALLACAPGEQHDLALIVFGLALRSRGWRVMYLGPDAPVATIAGTARTVHPAVVVIAAEMDERLNDQVVEELAVFARDFNLALAGAAVSPEIALRVGAQFLRDDPVTAGLRLTPAAAT